VKGKKILQNGRKPQVWNRINATIWNGKSGIVKLKEMENTNTQTFVSLFFPLCSVAPFHLNLGPDALQNGLKLQLSERFPTNSAIWHSNSFSLLSVL
jgi:hypothetical protein